MPSRRALPYLAREVTFAEFMKTHPPTFAGGSDVTKASNWLRGIETCFRLLRCPPQMKVDFAGYVLQEDAAEWWAGTREVTFGDSHEIEWDDFTTEFKDKYLPRHLINELRDEFRNLTQGSLLVPEYATKFVRLERHYPGLCEDEAERARKFVAGLDSGIRMQLMAARVTNLKEAVALADTLEKELKKNQVKKKAIEEGPGQSMLKRSKSTGINQVPQSKLCPHCKKAHGSKPCYRLTGSCFRCGKPGHIARNCTLAPKQGTSGGANENPRPQGVEGIERQRKVVSARAFALTNEEAEASTDVITGTR